MQLSINNWFDRCVQSHHITFGRRLWFISMHLFVKIRSSSLMYTELNRRLFICSSTTRLLYNNFCVTRSDTNQSRRMSIDVASLREINKKRVQFTTRAGFNRQINESLLTEYTRQPPREWIFKCYSIAKLYFRNIPVDCADLFFLFLNAHSGCMRASMWFNQFHVPLTHRHCSSCLWMSAMYISFAHSLINLYIAM